MAAGAYSDVAILGLTYAEDVASSYPDSDPDVAFEILGHDEDQSRTAPLDPQDLCSCSDEDFIIFSEFSEVQGPLPLLTIPSHIQEDDKLDMNAFILKIMSVDYQANQSGHFVLNDDAQVLQTSVVKNIHAYVHYFTLHDLNARGFVRPMCLAYVTRDKTKLHKEFPSLREKFLKVTHLIKFNNRQGFLSELVHNLHNLKSMQDRYFEWKRQEEEEDEVLTADDHQAMLATEIDQLVQQYTECKHLQHIVEPTLEDPSTKTYIAQWEKLFQSSDLREAHHFIKKLSSHQYAPRNGSPVRSKHIRPILAISPWGCLAALWSLLDIRHQLGACSLEVQFNKILSSFTPAPPAEESENQRQSVELALQSKEFLQLVHNLTYPKEWGEDEDMDATAASQDDLDYLEAHFLASGEGSGSYLSATGSMSELTPNSRPTSRSELSGSPDGHDASSDSSQSFHDLSVDTPDSLEEEESEPWTGCLWGWRDVANHNKPGRHILQFFLDFPQSAQHIVYSILIGRSVVLSGQRHDIHRACKIANSLTPLLPGAKQPGVLRWHQGILVTAHIEKYKIVGLCVPERLSVHDMISPKNKNNVTILDLCSNQLFGPAYSGTLLHPLKPACVAMIPSDQTLLLLLQALFTEIDSKVFLCRTIGAESLKELEIRGCDLSMVKYLASISSS